MEVDWILKLGCLYLMVLNRHMTMGFSSRGVGGGCECIQTFGHKSYFATYALYNLLPMYLYSTPYLAQFIRHNPLYSVMGSTLRSPKASILPASNSPRLFSFVFRRIQREKAPSSDV